MKPSPNHYVGHPAKPVNHVAAVDGDTGVVLVAGLILALVFFGGKIARKL